MSIVSCVDVRHSYVLITNEGRLECDARIVIFREDVEMRVSYNQNLDCCLFGLDKSEESDCRL